MNTWRITQEPEWEASEVLRSRQTTNCAGRHASGVEDSGRCRRKGLNPVLDYAWKNY